LGGKEGPFSGGVIGSRERVVMEGPSVPEDGILLEGRDVTLRFGGIEALNGLSFTIHPRRIVSIIGPNGAGKTTLLNTITGVHIPDRGEILFRGKTISGLKPHQITGLGISRTFQQTQLFSNLTVAENVMVGMHSRTNAGFLGGILHLPSERREELKIREEAEGLLNSFGLLARADWAASHIPIVEQRRLEIARALAGEPEVLLLDEPAAGLNIRETESMGDLIVGLREKGQTILLVEHNMHLVMGVSDWVIVLHHGSKIGEGRAEDVQKDKRVIDAYLGT
jgi:branched-chain amino acid transport system ATP-binding protein